MKKNKSPKIICPVCNRQYLPGEIYLPNEFVGQPKIIERDIYGKIISDYGGDMNLREQYVCDKCNTTFSIQAKVQFETTVKNSTQPFRMKLKQDKLQLKEQ